MARTRDEEPQVVAKARIKPNIGMMRPSHGREWRKAQVPYKNYAGFDEELDGRCTSYVMGRMQEFRGKTSGVMSRWAINWAASNTEVFWNEHEDDVHMPEVKKALDSKVARVEEGVTEFDPVFETEGVRGALNRRTGKALGTFIYRQMELANWKALVQPCARDAELCNVSALKIDWHEQVDTVVERHDEVTYDSDGLPVYTPIRKMRKAVTYRGPRMRQVDPFWFIYDLEANTVEECAYIGDESTPFLHELQADAEQGVYIASQVQKVADGATDNTGQHATEDSTAAEWADQMRQYRSIASGTKFDRDVKSEHGAIRVRLIEMWTWFNFGDGFEGVVDPLGKKLTGMQKVVITIANGIPIRIQQNPFDGKFAPYAFAQVNRNGHELVAPAPFDSVVQMNAHYDRLCSNIMRWMDLTVAPVVITQDQNTEIPDSLQEIKAGSVLHNTGPWNFIKVPDVTGSVGYFHHFFRNEHEELSGALRVHESPQGTATEVERKVQEQQRMVRNSIRASGELWRQAAILIKKLWAQFMVGPETFSVVGKAQKALGREATITPQMLREDVNFRFLGLTDVHVFGNRAHGIAQFMNMWGPLLPNMPEVNVKRMARTHFELLVGHAGTNDMFPEDEAPWDNWTQEEENAMLLQGVRVEVSKSDDDDEHLESSLRLLNHLIENDAPKYILDNVLEHANEHIGQREQKIAQQRSEMKSAQQRQLIQQATGGEYGTDQPPAPGGMPAHQQQGITPGPEQVRTVARTGRDGLGTSQTQAMTQ